ncbi:MAG: hypothetical protein NTW19_00415 [Planctomycetota bacterium]|nr:hypothetical protein [Planctomycetota bacterium]
MKITFDLNLNPQGLPHVREILEKLAAKPNAIFPYREAVVDERDMNRAEWVNWMVCTGILVQYPTEGDACSLGMSTFGEKVLEEMRRSGE